MTYVEQINFIPLNNEFKVHVHDLFLIADNIL